MVKIMLDAGHGKGSSYNRGSKFGNEGDNNFKFSLYLKKELETYGFEVGLTRPYESVGSNEDLYRRGSLGAGYDLFLSLHTNAGGGTGVEIFNSNTKGDKTLASRLCAVLSDVQGIKNRGVKYKTLDGSNLDWYGVLRHNKGKVGMLIEHCFHDNYNECKFYVENMEKIAKAEAKCIADYYGKSKISTSVEFTENEEEYMQQISERYLVTGDYSIDTLPWFCNDRKQVGTTKDRIGFVVTVSRKWGNYWYSQFLGGWIDSRAFEKIENVDITKTVTNGGYSVDTLPWGMNGFKTVMKTDELKGKSFQLSAKKGAYYYIHEMAKWVDEKAFGLEKKVAKKSVSELAREVLEGKWGNGQKRKTLLEKAGYDYYTVQSEVNRLSGKN